MVKKTTENSKNFCSFAMLFKINDEMRDRIIEVALNLFLKNGVRAITMDDIANNNGISKRTLYEIFKDKNNLLINCLNRLEKIKEEAYSKNYINDVDIVDMFLHMLQYGTQMIKTINPLFVEDIKKFHYQVWQDCDQKMRAQDMKFHSFILRKGIDLKLFRADINVEVVTGILLAQMQIIADESIFPSNKYSKHDIFENMLVNYVRGISTPAGIKLIDEKLDKYKRGLVRFEYKTNNRII